MIFGGAESYLGPPYKFWGGPRPPASYAPGFMFGKSSAERSLKLHLLRLEMQPLYQDVKICDLAL